MWYVRIVHACMYASMFSIASGGGGMRACVAIASLFIALSA